MITRPLIASRATLNSSLLMIVVLGSATPTFAQTASRPLSSCGDAPSFKQVFTGTFSGFRQLRTSSSLELAAIGAAAAFGTHPIDRSVTRSLGDPNPLYDTFKSGAVIGGTPFELGAAFGTYAVARALNKPCTAGVAADLVQAQLMAQGLTIGMKEATRRSRPEGTGFSFPSGHAAVAFASATVIQRHFGWKAGIPAYAVASYVAASRVEMKRHYLSDVAFGAALGIVAGRAVTVGPGRHLLLTPITAPEGNSAGLGFTWKRTE